VFDWPRWFGAAGTTIARGDLRFRGYETIKLSGDAGDIFGPTIDLAVHPELAGKPVYVAGWAKSTTTGANARVAVVSTNNTQSNAIDTNWRFVEWVAHAPSSGSFGVGISKFGADAGADVYFSMLVIAPVGVPLRSFNRESAPVPVWRAAAAPTVGTWAAGDRIWNTSPAAGGAPGWVCTTGGAPGTWKAMSALAP
jgi:hypothetical protein